MKRLKLSVWAKEHGVHYRTAERWILEGRFPARFEKTHTGRIYVLLEEPPSGSEGRAVIYARVSGSDQKSDLARQVERLSLFAAARGYSEVQIIKEVGSGLNGHRKGLLGILKDPQIKTIIVEHRDRLARFGVEHLETALAAQGRQVVVAEAGEQTIDLVQDFVDVVTSMCARIYGRRAAKNRAKRAVEAAAAEV
jgi:predicted site-specific integrase-resolvase